MKSNSCLVHSEFDKIQQFNGNIVVCQVSQQRINSAHQRTSNLHFTANVKAVWSNLFTAGANR